MRKVVCFLLVLLMAFALVGCANPSPIDLGEPVSIEEFTQAKKKYMDILEQKIANDEPYNEGWYSFTYSSIESIVGQNYLQNSRRTEITSSGKVYYSENREDYKYSCTSTLKATIGSEENPTEITTINQRSVYLNEKLSITTRTTKKTKNSEGKWVSKTEEIHSNSQSDKIHTGHFASYIKRYLTMYNDMFTMEDYYVFNNGLAVGRNKEDSEFQYKTIFKGDGIEPKLIDYYNRLTIGSSNTVERLTIKSAIGGIIIDI